MDYVSHLDHDEDTWKPSVNEVKHMEGQFKVYYNFVHLRMMILMTLYGQYMVKTSDADRAMTKTYLKLLKYESDLYKRYRQMCYNKIVDAYESYDRTEWQKSLKCINEWNQCEMINTRVFFDCSSRLDRMSLLESQTCDWKAIIRCDGDIVPYDYVFGFDIDPLSKENYALHLYTTMNADYYDAYHKNITSQVKSFWKPSVLKSQDTLYQIYEASKQELTNYEDVSEHSRSGYHSQAYHQFSYDLKAAQPNVVHPIKSSRSYSKSGKKIKNMEL